MSTVVRVGEGQNIESRRENIGNVENRPKKIENVESRREKESFVVEEGEKFIDKKLTKGRFLKSWKLIKISILFSPLF
jgi:hypothetical protein